MSSPTFTAGAAQRRLQSAGLKVETIERVAGPLVNLWLARTDKGDRWVGEGPQRNWLISKTDPRIAANDASKTRVCPF